MQSLVHEAAKTAACAMKHERVPVSGEMPDWFLSGRRTGRMFFIKATGFTYLGEAKTPPYRIALFHQ
jgi:hypothetical protein